MASPKASPLTITPSSRTLLGGVSPDPTPFRIHLVGVNDDDQSSTIRISRYSAVLASPDFSDRVPLIGLDLKLNVSYGQKIWLEIYYDKNLVPVFGVIQKGNKWPATTVNPSATSERITIYPKEHELITRLDLTDRIFQLGLLLTTVSTYKSLAQAEIDYQRDSGQITAEERTVFTEAVNVLYQQADDLIRAYKSNISAFFSAAPNTLWKKLYRTYTLIGYTSHEASLDLEGVAVRPRPPAPVEAAVNQASPIVPYRIVQCLGNDLLLADMCYQNRYPAKLPIAYHRPVYRFLEPNNRVEETENTR